jgi:hypothetical protein
MLGSKHVLRYFDVKSKELKGMVQKTQVLASIYGQP